jgi:serine/threonine protein kinase
MPKVGKYHIARKIADGGMAEIFLGTQHGMEGFERPVVLKRILAPLVADPQFRNMLIDEAHVAMGLNHSNIVQVLDLGRVRGRYFLVMELVDGWDLSQILVRATSANFPLPPEIVLYIAAEICRALAYAHARTRDGQPLGIVHRDVSPQNVLVSEQGEVKLTDFGIAKAMGRRERTNQGVIKGKLAFMSPEQASGAVLDSRSDLFSLGTLLYLFFTGRPPFEAPTDLESIMRVRACTFTPPEMMNPALGPELVKIIRRAMQALPANRYQNADEMLLDIESVQRTTYKPAGQTELKRWLAELQQRDHCPSISYATTAQAAEDESLDIGAGAEVVFDDSNVIDVEDVLRSMQPTLAAIPEQMAAALPRRKEKTKAEGPIDLGQSRIPSRIIVFALIIAALAVGASLAIRDDNRALGKRGQTFSAKRAPDVDNPESKPGVKTALVIDAGAKANPDSAAVAPPATATIATVENEEEEENLLKNAEPDDGKHVIGEDEGVRSVKKRATAKPSAAPVSVHVASTPEGAVVKLGKRVFGRAPMNLRFRPGITFELTFVKKGYVPATKRFTPTAQKKQTVRAVLLKRKGPAPKKSLFRRIFGEKF